MALRDCLVKKGMGNLRVYPKEIRELGATTNVSAILLREMNNKGFVHIEMNENLRTVLKEDINSRRAFLECVGKALSPPVRP
jgi:hypothetical protein